MSTTPPDQLPNMTDEDAANALCDILRSELARTERTVELLNSPYRKTIMERLGFTISTRKGKGKCVVFSNGSVRKASSVEVKLWEEVRRLETSLDTMAVEALKRRWCNDAIRLCIDLMRSWSTAYRASKRISMAFGSPKPPASHIKRLKLVEKWYIAISRCAAIATEAKRLLGVVPDDSLNSTSSHVLGTPLSRSRDPVRVDIDVDFNVDHVTADGDDDAKQFL